MSTVGMNSTFKKPSKQFARVGKSWPRTYFMGSNFLKNVFWRVIGKENNTIES
ncbi:hypothetical protein ABI125_09510 [Tamlana crocina]